MNLTSVFVSAIATALSVCLISTARCEIVYDSLTGATPFSGGIVLQPNGISQAGNVITLAGTSRKAIRADVSLGEFNTGSIDFRLNLWSPSDVPGTLIWTSPVQQSGPLTGPSKIFSFDVPLVELPDVLGWTVERIAAAGNPGIHGFPAPTVGSASFAVYLDGSQWAVGNLGNGSHGFRLFAVPEQASLTMLVIAIFAALSSCRRKSAARKQLLVERFQLGPHRVAVLNRDLAFLELWV